MIKDIKIKFAVNGLLAGLLLLSGAQTFGQQQAADISQVVSAAIDSAGRDPVSIEAAIRTVMNDVGPTAAGMQQIASAAIRKVAGYNERELTASISKGTINAALGQALNTGVNPLHATALVSEGLVSTATQVIARKGGNSVGTAKAVSESTMQSVVETSGRLGISVQAAANAAAFGAMNASLSASIDYGQNTSSTARDVTTGLTTGAIKGANRIEVDPAKSIKAVLHGATDSIYAKADQFSINPTLIVKAAQAGFNQALTAAQLREGIKVDFGEDEEVNNDLLGATIEFGSKILQMKRTQFIDGKEVEVTQLVLIPDKPITEEVTWEIFLEEKLLGEDLIEPTWDLGEAITEEEIGEYKFIAKRLDGTEVISKTKNVFLINNPLPPVSPSS